MRYIVVRFEPLGNNKINKIPCDYRTGNAASAYDASIHIDTLDTARNWAVAWGSNYGVGGVIEAPYFFLDIDHCIDDEGVASPVASALLAAFPGAFVEVSVSGRGLHIIGSAAHIPDHRCKADGFDLYTTGRFVALTYQQCSGSMDCDHTGALAALVAATPRLQPNTAGAESVAAGADDEPEQYTDDELIAAGMRSRSAGSMFGGRCSFADLWTADPVALGDSFPCEGRPYDASSADMTLACMLMFYTGGRVPQAERLMRRSALMRPKWDQHPTYLREFTLARARERWNGVSYTGGRGVVAQGATVAGDPDGPLAAGAHGFTFAWPEIKLPSGKPKNVLSNFRAMMQHYGVSLRYNMMSREPEIIIPGAAFMQDNARGDALTTLTSLCEQLEFPVSHLPEYLNTVANETPFHPALVWIQSTVWDGVDRIEPLIDTLDSDTRELTAILVRKWLNICVDALTSSDGIQADGVLVLQGAQNCGKSTWVRRLAAGFGTDIVSIDPRDRDSKQQATGYWIAELLELDGTTRRVDSAALKGFLTQRYDEFRPAYARVSSKYPRRTVFAATVNPVEFMQDDTGNRRFWTVRCGPRFNSFHEIDIQQLWSQVLATRGTEPTYLSRAELVMLNGSNDQHDTAVDPIGEMITRVFDLTAPRMIEMTLTDIFIALGIEPNRRAMSGTRIWVERIMCDKFKRRTHESSAKTIMMPLPKINFT